MKIKSGFGEKETEINISKSGKRTAELWINQTGLTGLTELKQETLSYLTLEELLNLRDEINEVIKEITK